jgi:hypothetical protein
MKNFKSNFNALLNRIKNKENFAITRFGDGEMMIINGVSLNLLNKGAGEFAYDSENPEYVKSKELLTKSFSYQSDDYYVGIACKCCVGDDKYQNMKITSGQKEENLTWANIFVNSNFELFNKQMIPALKERRVYLIAHEASDTTNLPFEVEKFYKVKADAWLHNIDLIDELKYEITESELEDIIFLISAGPFANILVQQLNEHNKNNTYIDLGSVLDRQLGLPATRGYLKGSPTLNKTCIW